MDVDILRELLGELMYFATVILLLLVLPAISIVFESLHEGVTLILVGKWFVFWAAGVRLFIAGLRQVLQPGFTAQEIFGLTDRGAFAIVRELGFANISMGLLSICSLFHTAWVVPGAVVGGLYYGLAAAGHVGQAHRNAKENMALYSDVWICLVLAWFVTKSLWSA
jgi:hypothetical protein